MPTNDVPRHVLEESIPIDDELVWAFDQLFDTTWHSLSEQHRQVLIVLSFFNPTTFVSDSLLSKLLEMETGTFQKISEDLVRIDLVKKDLSTTSTSRLIHLCITRRESGLVPAVFRKRWLKYYVDLVIYHGDKDIGTEIGDGKPGNRERLEQELANIRIAISWALEHDQISAVKLIQHITTLLLDTGRWDERINLCRKGLSISEQLHRIDLQIGFLQRLGWSYFVRGQYEESEQYLTKAQSLVISFPQYEDNPARYPQILRDLGILIAHKPQGDFDQAFRYLQLSVAVAQTRRLKVCETIASAFWGWAKCLKADKEFIERKLPQARSSYRDARRHLESILSVMRVGRYLRQQTFVLRLLARCVLRCKLPNENRLSVAHDLLTEASGFESQFYKAYVQAELYRAWGDWYVEAPDFPMALSCYKNGYFLAILWGMQHEARELKKLIEFYDPEYALSVKSPPPTGNQQVKVIQLFDNMTETESDFFHYTNQQKSHNLSEIEDIRKPFEEVFNSIINELRTEGRKANPTKAEQVLNVFLEQNSDIVSLEQLLTFFSETRDPEQSTRDCIVRLNKKLAPHNLRIDHVTAYTIRTK
ncbi:MAG TPA: hypothetical protein PLQ56_06610 [Aggregatilineales bacterium]|nr:hypothetical protein [Aggregatilineales bacterium]